MFVQANPLTALTHPLCLILLDYKGELFLGIKIKFDEYLDYLIHILKP